MPRERLTRRERSEGTRSRRRGVLLALAAALVGISAIAGGVIIATAVSGLTPGSAAQGSGNQTSLTGLDDPAAARGADYSSASATLDASATASVEIPTLAGKSVAEARAILEAVGLAAEIRPGVAENDLVTTQEPEPGAVVPQGTGVRLATGDASAPPGMPSARATRVLAALDGRQAASAPGSAPAPSAPTVRATGLVVVIDPGHQSKGDSTHEPIGPGASETKPRVTGGTTGVTTKIPEYEVVLQISTNLKARLEQAGVTVIMTRTTNDVNISNSERAAIANDAGADLFVRIHADGSTDSTVAGISTLYPGENRWTAPIAAPSARAATRVHEATVAATAATSRGTRARTDLSGFNWARVPSVLVECGFMSNPVEDRLLSSPHYQDKLAEGMATGILSYLNGTGE